MRMPRLASVRPIAQRNDGAGCGNGARATTTLVETQISRPAKPV